MENNKLSYSEAIKELEEIVNKMGDENIEVDKLSEAVKRASFLIKLCREKLKITEQEVNDLLKEISEAEKSEE
ncbi:MAG TPA: exodeoxyribonuclease VII small subunit [Bacteroidales bacterium]|nr:exodeoxyribonuclease VII small subunit [Bacteroidales bacterium]